MPGLNLNALRSRSSFALAIGFGFLVVLIAVLGLGALRRARAINREMRATEDAYLKTESFRRDIATDMYLSDILVRDYLLDPSPQNAPRHREELLRMRGSLQGRLELLSTTMQDSSSPGLGRLNNEVQKYWDSLDPIFEWTPKQKAELSWFFLRYRVLPRRQAVVGLVREVARLNRENLERERRRIQDSQAVFEQFLMRMMGFALVMGILVAVVTTYRVTVLERRHDIQTREIEDTQNNLRRLSRRLVQAQETERKALSRELHDEVGQTLTALGMELANLPALRQDAPGFQASIGEARRLNSGAMRSLRDLAMGLRPSMLDDLGLEAAVEWQGREFSRRTGVPATVQVNGALDELTDTQRTCIYRVVQEALTNCARHAHAHNVLVTLAEKEKGIAVVVHDDGIGFDPKSIRGGLGLLGIQERVQELDGRVSVVSAQGRGTTIRAELPLEVAA